MEVAGADPREGMSAERASQPDPLGFGTHGRHVSADTTFVFGFHYLVRMVNLACAVSIGTTPGRVAMIGAVTVSERRNQLTEQTSNHCPDGGRWKRQSHVKCVHSLRGHISLRMNSPGSGKAPCVSP